MKPLKTIAAASALSLVLVGFSLPIFAAEKTEPMLKLQPAKVQMHKYKHKRMHKRMHRKACRKPVTASWRKALRSTRVLNINDAKTVTQAALILNGDRNTSIENIKPFKNKRGNKAFLIRLSNSQTNDSKTLVMNSKSGRLIDVTNKGKFANAKQ